MRVVRADEMRAVDRQATAEFGISSLILMENAGRAITDVIEEYFDLEGLKLLVIAGKGNNGGDGFVVARHAKNRGADVTILLLGNKTEIKGDARINLDVLDRAGIEVVEITKQELLKAKMKDLGSADVVVDAIFGTGFSGKPAGIYQQAITLINRSAGFVLAVDIPSGVSADDGSVEGETVEADATVTMGLVKRGHFLYPGRSRCGDVWVADIGIPYHRIESEGDLFALDDREIQKLMPARPAAGHKGSFGRVFVVAGSRGYGGAAVLASIAAQKIGAGLVHLGFPQPLANSMETKLTEVIKIPLPATIAESLALRASTRIEQQLADCTVLALGPGLGTHPETKKLVHKIVDGAHLPVVLDADGLNAFEGKAELLLKTKAPLVLTPHPGELARLLNRTPADIDRHRVDLAGQFAHKFRVVLVLKGAPTVIAEPSGKIFINPTGNSGLAAGGTGDVLTGFIAGLIGQGLSPLDAAQVGVYLHGRAADLAAEERTEYALVASDLVDYLPRAIKSLEEEDEDTD